MIIRRLRIFFKHHSPFERDIIEEISLENVTNMDIEDLIFPLNDFKMGLKVFNADGYELPYLPKEQIENIARSIVEEELVENINKWLEGAILWVKLPPNRVIKPNETRIIKLAYKDSRKLKSYYRSCFSIPDVIETRQIKKIDGFDTFYIIEIPEKYKIKINMMTSRGIPKLYVNKTDSLVSLRAPYKVGTYKLEFGYKITLSYIEELFWKMLMLCLSIGTVITIFDYCNYISIFHQNFTYYTTFISALISICLLVLKSTSEPIIYRIKNFSLVLLIVNLISLLVVIIGDWNVA